MRSVNSCDDTNVKGLQSAVMVNFLNLYSNVLRR